MQLLPFGPGRTEEDGGTWTRRESVLLLHVSRRKLNEALARAGRCAGRSLRCGGAGAGCGWSLLVGAESISKQRGDRRRWTC